MESGFGRDFSDVRVHTDSIAAKSAQAVNAVAYAAGKDVVFAAGQYSPDSSEGKRLLAHELTHVVQQGNDTSTSAIPAQVQRQPTAPSDTSAQPTAPSTQGADTLPVDPTLATLTPAEVDSWTGAQVSQGIELLASYLEPVVLSDETREASIENLRLLIHAAVARSITIPADALGRLPAEVAPTVDPKTLFAMNSRLDLIAAMVRRDFPNDAPSVEIKLEQYRLIYPWLTDLDLADASISLETGVRSVETAARIKRLAVDPGGDSEVTASIGRLDVALSTLLDALLTPDLSERITDAETARNDWLQNTADAFVRTALSIRHEIEAEIDPQGFGMFSNGIFADDVFVLSSQVSAISDLNWQRGIVVSRIDALIKEAPTAAVPVEDRLGFVVQNSQRLDLLMAQAEAVAIGRSVCQQGQVLADTVYNSSVPGQQLNRDNYFALNELRLLLPKFTVDIASRQELDRLRAQAEGVGARTDERIDAIRSSDRRVAWFINIAATLVGIGAMRAVMAVPAIAGLGRTAAGIIGSLAFTGTRLALTRNEGRPLSAGGVLKDAAKDYLLFRILGGVDARITVQLGETGALATAARIGGAYGTLAAWTLAWNQISPPPVQPGASPPSTGEILGDTARDFAAILIAEALLRAPAITSAELAPRDGAGDRRQLLSQWESHRAEMESTGRKLREWMKSKREDVRAGDALMVRADNLVASTRKFLDQFEQIGELTAEQHGVLDAETRALQESIRNARDEARLGVRSATGETWSYQGSPENIAAYLARLKQQGRVVEISAEADGIFSVQTSDGSIQWFYPESRTSPLIIDVVGESVEAAAPDVPENIRSAALENLRGAGYGLELSSFAGGLAPGRGAPFIRWAARPDVGATLMFPGLPLPLLKTLAASDQNLAEVADVAPRHLSVWSAAWAERYPAATQGQFLDALRDVMAWRGTVEVPDEVEAGELLERRAGALAPRTLLMTPPTGPSISAADAPHADYSGGLVAALKGEIVPGAEYSFVRKGASQWVIERVDGEINRLFEVGPDNSIRQTVPVKEYFATLLEILIAVQSAPDDGSAEIELARADEPLAALSLLLDLKSGVSPDQIELMTALAHHPLCKSTTSSSEAASPQDAYEHARDTQNLIDRLRGSATTARPAELAKVNEIKNLFPQLQELDAAAIQRLLDLAPDEGHIKGQLLEEIGINARLAKGGVEGFVPAKVTQEAKAQGMKLEFVPGYAIRDANGAMISDGIIGYWKDGRFNIVTFFESKGGRASGRGLRRKWTGIPKAERPDLLEEAQAHGIADLRESDPSAAEAIAHAMEMLRKNDKTARNLLQDDILANRLSDVEKYWARLPQSESGQITKTTERLVPGYEEETVTLQLYGKEVQATTAGGTPHAVGVLPSDVAEKSLAEAVKGGGIRSFERMRDVPVTQGDLETMAKKIAEVAAAKP